MSGAPQIRLRTFANFQHKLMPRSHKAVSRVANRKAMEYHWEKHLPEHTQAGAGTRYGYKQRRSVIGIGWLQRTDATSYARIRKLTMRGRVTNLAAYKDVKSALGLRPLVWSGDTERRLKNPINRKITSTPKGGRLQVRLGSYATTRLDPRAFRDGRPTQKQRQARERAAEIEALTVGEIRTLRKVFKAEYLDIVNNEANPNHGLVALRQRAKRRVQRT